MEPITHFLTGARLGRAGLNRKTAYATLAAVLAAEAADMDVLWGLHGPVAELQHHRGISHTLVAAPVVAGVVVGAVWLLDRGWRQLRRRQLEQPIIWGWLFLTTLLAALSHLLLDWTNNYGVRPFYPFNSHWYAGSLVFIYEPVLWALLLAALILPALFGLADAEIGAKKKEFRWRGWAIFALCGMVVFWCGRWVEQAQARAMIDNTQIAADPVKRVGLEPYPLNPFHWHAILETSFYFQTAEVDTRTGAIESDPHRSLIYKPTETVAVQAAKRTPLGQVYMDWGTWSVVRDLGPVPVAGMAPPQLPPNRTWTTVEFRDLRFAYPFWGSGSSRVHAPLSGYVYIVDGWENAGEILNGREQR